MLNILVQCQNLGHMTPF